MAKKNYILKAPHTNIIVGTASYCDGKLLLFKKQFPERFEALLKQGIIIELKESNNGENNK